MAVATPAQGPAGPLVRFHFNVSDRLAYVHTMLSKTARRSLQVAVLGPRPLLDELSRRLWTTDDISFIAHQRWPGAGAPASAHNRIWLIEVGRGGGDGVEADVDDEASAESIDGAGDAVFLDAAASGVNAPVLINLSRKTPLQWPGLSTLVEVVPLDADERDAGRRRWKTYQAQGLTIESVDARGENGA